MKRILCLLMLCLLVLPCAAAEEADWYYPFGFTEKTTFDDAVIALTVMFGQDDAEITNDGNRFVIKPVGKKMFGMPLRAITVTRSDDGKYEIIGVALFDSLNANGYNNYFEALNYLAENTKTEMIGVEPHTVEYGLDGKAVYKTFLNDLDGFAEDFMSRTVTLSYEVYFFDCAIKLDKNGNNYMIQLFFAGKSVHND